MNLFQHHEEILKLERKSKPNEKFTSAQIIAALEASAGILSAAARMLRCDRKTVYNYVNRYPEVAAALLEVEECRTDIAEAAIIKMMADNSNPSTQLSACIFYLKHRGKHRGYTTRTEVVGKHGGPIETKRVNFDLSGLSAEELAELERHALISVAKARMEH